MTMFMLAMQLALLPLQAILFLGHYRERVRVEAIYKRSLLRLTHRSY